MQSKVLVRAISPAIVAFLLAGCGSAPKVQSAGGPPPVPVTVATAGQQTVPIEIRVIGTVEPSATVQVKSQISGELLSVHFVEGGDVKKGDLLFEIDPRPYQEALQQAEAALPERPGAIAAGGSQSGTRYRAGEERRGDAARYTELAKKASSRASKASSTAPTPTPCSNRCTPIRPPSKARAHRWRAIAPPWNAPSSISSYCEIRSPFSGRAGNLLVHAGNLVMANGPNPLVVINQIAPIFVTFGVPEEQLPAIRDRSKNDKLPVQVSLQNDADKTAHGILTVIDNTVDPNTGTIKLKATFANQDRILWPGTFVNVALVLDSRDNAIVVPAEAVQAGQQGSSFTS